MAWALYDFANSAFATTILAVIFNVYFVQVICRDLPIPGESLWGYAVSASMLMTFLSAPLLGAIADRAGLRKRFLAVHCYGACLFTGLLFWMKEGDWVLASILFLLANVGFTVGNAFYNSFLLEISSPGERGRISGYGWALGYLGGGALLALNLGMLKRPELFGIPTQDYLPVRFCLLSAAIWWALFSIPFFLWIKEERPARSSTQTAARPAQSLGNSLARGLSQLASTLRKVKEKSELFKFLIAYLIYNDGIETVILVASIFGAKVLGMENKEIVLCFLMIQAVAFVGSLIFGFLADLWGHKPSILLTLAIFLGATLWASIIQSASQFWILGAFIGLVLGGSQAASRSLLALLAPPAASAEYFGFFALAGKLSTVAGPFLFGLVSQFFSLRAAAGSLSLFFLAGGLILLSVDESLGRAQAVSSPYPAILRRAR